MKKRVVLALLLIAMVCALFTVTSLAADYDHTSHEGWTELTNEYLATVTSDQYSYTLPAGNYYLADDLVLTKQLRPAKTVSVVICLGGNTLSRTNGRLLNVDSGVTVTICDCTETKHAGYVSAGNLWTPLAEGATAPADALVASYPLTGGILTGKVGDAGGAIFSGGNLILDGVNIAGSQKTSTSSHGGGAIYANNTSKTTLIDTVIVGNTSATIAGGVYAQNTLNMTNTVVAYNKTATYGGGVYAKTSNFTLTDGNTIEHNTATKAGGGLYVDAGVTVKMTGGEIKNNVAATEIAGGVEVIGTFNLSGGTISGNVAKALNGGGIGIYGGTVNMTGGTIDGNYAGKNGWNGGGGGVSIANGGTLNMSAGKISNNISGATSGTAPGSSSRGGAIFLGSVTTETAVAKRDKVIISGTAQITGNKAGGFSGLGSGVYVAYTGDLEINGGLITGNNANGDVYVFAETSDVNIATMAMTDGIVGGINIQNTSPKSGVVRNGAVATVTGGKITKMFARAYPTRAIPATITVTGGTFHTGSAVIDVTSFKPTGYTQFIDGTVLKDPLADSTDAAVMVTGSFGGEEITAYFATPFNDAETHSSSYFNWAARLQNGTVTFLKDYTFETSGQYIARFDKLDAGKMTIDLNNKKITLKDNYMVCILGDAEVTVKNGSVYRLSTATSGAILQFGSDNVDPMNVDGSPSCPVLTLDNVDIYNNAYAPGASESATPSYAPIVNSKVYNLDFTICNGSQLWNDSNQILLYFDVNSKYSGRDTSGMVTVTMTDSVLGKTGTGLLNGISARVPNYVFEIGEGTEFVTVAGGMFDSATKNLDYTVDTVRTYMNKTYTVAGVAVGGADREVKYYDNIVDNAAALEANQTVKLLKDITVDEITAPAGTVDLNGKELTVGALIAPDAHIVDSSDAEGKLNVDDVVFNPDNKQFVFDHCGSIFSEVAVATKVKQISDDAASYAFNLYFKSDAMDDAILNRDVDCEIGVTVTAEVGGVVKSKEFIATKEALGLDVEPISYLLNNPSHGLRFSLQGMENFENVKVEMFFRDKTSADVVYRGGETAVGAPAAN